MSVIENSRLIRLSAGMFLLGLGVNASAQEIDMVMVKLDASHVKESVERIARFTPLGYASEPAHKDGIVRWLQVDLGQPVSIEKVKLYPHLIEYGIDSPFFPIRFKIDAADDPEFKTSACIVDCTRADVPSPQDVVGIYPARGVKGRYVRLTVTKVNNRENSKKIITRKYDLSKLEVWSKERDVAEGRPIRDSINGDLGITLLTRHPRPQGEGVFTDNLENVIPSKEWKPVAYLAKTPRASVQVTNGVFEQAVRDNIVYLLESFTVDEMLREFRERAGKPNPPNLRKPSDFWETTLAGSCAGRFLTGAGNTLRWMENAELRQRMNTLVDGIAECRQTNGYIMAYSEDTIFQSERGAYTRSWLTQGLIEAGYAGNPKAFELLRGYYDWFDRNPYLPELLRRAGQGVQGMIANTRLYFTPVGKPEDLQVIQRYFQENYWLEQLAKRDPDAFWKYPYDHPHSYLITSLEPYLDLYRATGKALYLQAAQGGWDLLHDNWQLPGGSFTIRESDVHPPKSYFLHKGAGEICGSAFWIFFNQRFHQLDPYKEKFVDEIEKSIYNVMLAAFDCMEGPRIGWQLPLDGRKPGGSRVNTCCECQGTRVYSALPEFIYMLAADGVFVDLFQASTVEHQIAGQSLTVKMETVFPFQPGVRLSLKLAKPLACKLNIRVPAWAAADMPVLINGVTTVTGKPGSYVTLERTWKDGDTLQFSLPMGFKLTHYEGIERIPGQEQYTLEYGPLLMAVIGPMETTPGNFATSRLALAVDAKDLIKKLAPKNGEPLHFTIAGCPEHEYKPYWKITPKQSFTCYPILEGDKQ
jgi:DUF1680 family protein